MTVDDLYKLLSDSADATVEARECPDMDGVLRSIAEWVHIDQKGFARSDLVHMQLECRALIGLLSGTHSALADLASRATDDQ
jgi:hypothetical protein